MKDQNCTAKEHLKALSLREILAAFRLLDHSCKQVIGKDWLDEADMMDVAFVLTSIAAGHHIPDLANNGILIHIGKI